MLKAEHSVYKKYESHQPKRRKMAYEILSENIKYKIKNVTNIYNTPTAKLWFWLGKI